MTRSKDDVIEMPCVRIVDRDTHLEFVPNGSSDPNHVRENDGIPACPSCGVVGVVAFSEAALGQAMFNSVPSKMRVFSGKGIDVLSEDLVRLPITCAISTFEGDIIPEMTV